MQRCILFLFVLFHGTSYSQESVLSIFKNAVTALPANDAVLSNGLKTADYQDLDKDPKIFAIHGWMNKDQSFTWNINVKEKADYKIAVLLQVKGLSSNASITLQLSSPKGIISLRSRNAGWDKMFFPDLIGLEEGNNTLQLKLENVPEGQHPDISVYSIEAGTQKAWQQNNTDAEKLRSKPKWFTEAKYGLFFHWNARSAPRTGEPKSYENAVKDFDVTKFAAMVHETGADFIVLTTSWDLQTFPAPLKSLDKLLPGNTTTRDLVADLADALSRWNIKLMVYCNVRLNRLGWKKEDRFVRENMDGYFNKMNSIYQEIGKRYAKKIGGLWIDDGMGLYGYNFPFQKMVKELKKNDKEMIIGFNSWIYPRFTDFQDFYVGENGISMEAAAVSNKALLLGGNGYFVSGPQQGLKATFCGLLEPGNWTHTELNQEIPPPLLKTDELITIMKEAIKKKNAAILNTEVYQDGTISPATFDMLKQLNKAVH